jgi:small-conductance mechanosensitive channel
MLLQGFEDLLTIWRLLLQIWNVVGSVFAFFVGGAIVYLPGRYLVVPGARRLLDWYGLEANIELPFLKILEAAFAVAGAFVGISLSGLGQFLTASEAIGAAATIAFGFAAQDVLSNLVSGAFIVLDPKFNIGDWIEWDDNEGIVEDISFRVTRIHTFDNELITVPNAKLAQAAIRNPVAKDRRRISYEFGIGYDDDIDRATAILVEEAGRNPNILDRPRPTVVISELAESYVGLTARFWIDQPQRTDFLRIRTTYVQAVKERFDAEGIEMPYPYRQLTGTVGTRVVEAEDPAE